MGAHNGEDDDDEEDSHDHIPMVGNFWSIEEAFAIRDMGFS